MITRYSRRRAIALGVGATAAGLIAACGGSGTGGTGSATPAAGGGFALEPRPKPPAKRPAPGVMRLGRLRAHGATPAADPEDLLLAYSRLVAVDPRGPAVYPDVARAVEVPDPRTVRFTIREGQRFHADGAGNEQPLSAESVRTDFQRRAAEGVTFFSEVVERIDRPDSSTLVIHLKAPFGLLFELLALPTASIRGDGLYAGTSERVGSGPWVPARRDGAIARFAVSRAAEGDLRPLLGGIELVPGGSPPELDAAFARGEIDVRVAAAGAVAPADLARGAAVQRRAARRLRGLGLSLLPLKNGATVRHIAAFQDARVRRAVALSLAREPLLALDRSYVSGPVGPAFAGDALPERDLLAHPIYRHDPAEARRLLAAAGAEGLTFRVLVPDLPFLLQTSQILNDNLQDVGFQPRLQNLPVEAWQKSFMAGDFEATLFDIGGLDTPDVGLRLHTTEGIAGRFSLWGYSQPAYDVAVRAALAEVDPRARAAKSRAAQRMLLDDGPAMLPIGAAPEHASVAAGVTGYQFEAYDMNAGYLASGWSVPQRA